MSLYSELKRRNVFRVAIAYLAAAWLITEVSETLFPLFGYSDTPARIVVILLAIGFPLFLVFSWVYEITPEGLKLERDVVREESITPQTGKKIDRVIIVLLALGMAYFAFDKFVLDPIEDVQIAESAHQEGRSEALTKSYGDKSIAVLPFVNMSADPEQEYFSDGISEELLNLLAKIPELRVISRSSAFSFKDKDFDMPTIAAQLNVAHVLEGSVRKSGDQVRITAQLIEANTDTHLWSETYDRNLEDIFSIQDEIAEAVVDVLKMTLLGDAPKSKPTDPKAYALYLQAVHVGARFTNVALEQSNALLKQVLGLDPTYARAWRVLARNYAVQAEQGSLPREEGLALARDAITQALAIDPNLAEAHSWFGMFVAQHGGELTEAAQQIQRGLSLEPKNPIVLSHSADFLEILGRLDEAIAIEEYVTAHDPLNPIVRWSLSWNYLLASRPDEAIATARTLLRLHPGQRYAQSLLGLALLNKGQKEAALQAIQQEPAEGSRLLSLVMAYHALDQAAESDAALTELIIKYEQEWPYYIATVLAYRGEVDRAFAWLNKAARHQDTDLMTIASGWSWFTNLHDDPRWLPFLEGIGKSPEQLAGIEFEVKLPE